MLEQVRRWVNSLPAASRNLPIVHVDGRYWTPNEILRQIETCPNCATSIRLQTALETRHLGQGTNIWELAKERLLKALQLYPAVIYTYTLGKPIITPQELKQEIALETAFGVSLIEMETRRVQRELALYG
jgi:hypothetical protein